MGTRLFVLMLVIMSLAFGVFLLDARNRAFVFGSAGYMTSGTRYGITVGDAREKAGLMLAPFGFFLGESKHGGECMTHDHPRDQQIDVYYDDSWRHGIACVISAKDRIVAIESGYASFPTF